MKKLSIVIPCYKCESTIERLMDSILDGGLEKDDYEVIICDDSYPSSLVMLLTSKYMHKVNFVFCKTETDFHCPGNTRQAALQYISGEWFTFIDNDDMFIKYSLKRAMSEITTNNVEYVLCTSFWEYDDVNGVVKKEFKGQDTDTWLHGKFYNKKHILDEFGAHFKKDLFSHEDVYFNSLILSKLISIGKDYVYSDSYTYLWVDNPRSLSRSYYHEKDFYIEKYLGDYIFAASDPFITMYKYFDNEGLKQFAINQIIMTLLHAYFYYQAACYRLGPDNVEVNMKGNIHELLDRIINELGIEYQFIIRYVYSFPERYNSIKQKSFNASNPFIELESFNSFIYNLISEE